MTTSDPPAGPAAAVEGEDAGIRDADDPYRLFADWLTDAERSEPNDPNAMTLATVDGDGLPSARMVLLKGVDSRGFVFYTNAESAKGTELAGMPKAAACFHWKSLRRQVRLRGPVETVTAEEADAYFATRPHGSQIGAWASLQSRPLAHRAELIARVGKVEARYVGRPVPRPPHWLGYRIVPVSIEFWKDRLFRLHDRLVFTRADDGWRTTRLYP